MLHARSRSTRSPRFSLRMACQVVRERDFKLVATSVMNVSESGLFVDGDEPVRFGEKIIVTFYSPATRNWIDAESYFQFTRGEGFDRHGRTVGHGQSSRRRRAGFVSAV